LLSHPLLPSFSFLRSSSGKISAGSPNPLGATWDGRGTNFALFSANATKVELCLFDREGRRETERIVDATLSTPWEPRFGDGPTITLNLETGVGDIWVTRLPPTRKELRELGVER